jgi:hypothetical protein
MDLGVAFSANQEQVPRVVRPALIHFDDVVNLEAHRRPERLEVLFLSEALPAVAAHGLGEQFLQVFVGLALWLAVFRWLADPRMVVDGATDLAPVLRVWARVKRADMPALGAGPLGWVFAHQLRP